MIRTGKRARSESPSPKKLRPVNCVACKKTVGSSDDVFECVWCERVQHRTCLQISSEQYSAMSDVSSNILFFCCVCLNKLPAALLSYDGINSACSSVEKSVMSMETKLSNRFDSLSDHFRGSCSNDSYDELKSQVCNVSTQVKDLISNNNQLQKQIEAINSSLKEMNKKSYAAATQATNSLTPLSNKPSEGPSANSSSQPPTSDMLRNAVSSVINEEKEKQKRKLNLIVHNMEESSADQAQSRKEHDITAIRDILGSQLEVQPRISNAVRLGRKGGPKPRLLKITVESEDEKASILRNVKKLRLSSTPEHLKRIFITPDLTQKEREVNKVLRSELAERNKSGRQFRIKNGRIVQRRE